MIKDWNLFMKENATWKKFEVGDKVRYIYNPVYSAVEDKELDGKIGTVVGLAWDNYIAVSFEEKFAHSHDCGGLCKYGYWIDKNLLIPYNKEPGKGKTKWYSRGKLTLDPNSNMEVDEYDDFITDDVFREFLLKNGAYEKFIKNCLIQKKRAPGDFSKTPREEFINYSLTWVDTPEGSSYWQRLSDNWKKYVRGMNMDESVNEEAKLQGKKAVGLRCKVKNPSYEYNHLKGYARDVEDFYGTINAYNDGDYEVILDADFGRYGNLNLRYYKYKDIDILGPDFKEPKSRIRWWRGGRLWREEEE